MISFFSNLLSFMQEQRRSGTSTLLKKIAKENDVWILVPTEKEKDMFDGKGITFLDIENNKIKGQKPKPILVDNYTLIKLSEQALLEFSELRNKINSRNTLIRNIKEEIKLFERENNTTFGAQQYLEF